MADLYVARYYPKSPSLAPLAPLALEIIAQFCRGNSVLAKLYNAEDTILVGLVDKTGSPIFYDPEEIIVIPPGCFELQ